MIKITDASDNILAINEFAIKKVQGNKVILEDSWTITIHPNIEKFYNKLPQDKFILLHGMLGMVILPKHFIEILNPTDDGTEVYTREKEKVLVKEKLDTIYEKLRH